MTTISQQHYYSMRLNIWHIFMQVDEVRTADDAILRVKLMMFFELTNIETMVMDLCVCENMCVCVSMCVCVCVCLLLSHTNTHTFSLSSLSLSISLSLSPCLCLLSHLIFLSLTPSLSLPPSHLYSFSRSFLCGCLGCRADAVTLFIKKHPLVIIGEQ